MIVSRKNRVKEMLTILFLIQWVSRRSRSKQSIAGCVPCWGEMRAPYHYILRRHIHPWFGRSPQLDLRWAQKSKIFSHINLGSESYYRTQDLSCSSSCSNLFLCDSRSISGVTNLWLPHQTTCVTSLACFFHLLASNTISPLVISH